MSHGYVTGLTFYAKQREDNFAGFKRPCPKSTRSVAVVQSSVTMQRGNACTTCTNPGAANKEVLNRRLVLVHGGLVRADAKDSVCGLRKIAKALHGLESDLGISYMSLRLESCM